MARTVIEESSTSPTYVEESGIGPGVVLGVLIGIAMVVLLVLFLSGTFDNGTKNSPVPGTGNPGASAPAQPSSQASTSP